MSCFIMMEGGLTKLWTRVQVKILSDDTQFNILITDDQQQSAHIFVTPCTPLNVIWSVFNTMVFADNGMSVELTPFGRQYVKVWYSGPHQTATFSVILKETSKRVCEC